MSGEIFCMYKISIFSQLPRSHNFEKQQIIFNVAFRVYSGGIFHLYVNIICYFIFYKRLRPLHLRALNSRYERAEKKPNTISRNIYKNSPKPSQDP